jgi:hypothetical protein
MTAPRGPELDLLPGSYAVARLGPGDPVPAWAHDETLMSVTRTAGELSVVCPQDAVPAGVRCERGFRALALRGPLDFALTGVLHELTGPLARAGIPVLAISTFDTDVLLVRDADLPRAARALGFAQGGPGGAPPHEEGA